MPVNDRNVSLLNERVGKTSLFVGNFVAPVRSPMEGYDNHVMRLSEAPNLVRNAGNTCLGKIGQKAYAWGFLRCGPIAGNAARDRSERKDKHATFVGDLQDRRRTGPAEISAGT